MGKWWLTKKKVKWKDVGCPWPANFDVLNKQWGEKRKRREAKMAKKEKKESDSGHGDHKIRWEQWKLITQVKSSQVEREMAMLTETRSRKTRTNAFKRRKACGPQKKNEIEMQQLNEKAKKELVIKGNEEWGAFGCCCVAVVGEWFADTKTKKKRPM